MSYNEIDEISRLQKLHSALELRHKILRNIRGFFDARGFLEVDTPLRIPVPALERHIDAIPAGAAWLRTSPEFHMKRLLAAGYPKIFQIGPCFRMDEFGHQHNPEFCMLEWYRADADYMDILADAKELATETAHTATGSPSINYKEKNIRLDAEWRLLPVSRAFRDAAGWDPAIEYDSDRFNLDLVNKVEPQFPDNIPTVLMDYPEQQAALARIRRGNPPTAERWELYIGGLELANAFTELTNPIEQRRRFNECAEQRRAAGKSVYPLDEKFLAALEYGLPPCAGAALGVDRLLMLLADAASLDETLPFRE